MKRPGVHLATLVLGLVADVTLVAQAPLAIDPSFRTDLTAWYVSGLLPLENGKVIASGQMRYQGELLFRALMRFDSNGALDESFYQSGLGGGRIEAWRGDTFYVGTSQTVRRILPTGYRDQSFIEMNSSPLFSSLQGGDYHIYPDGSVVMSGLHNLNDPTRGFVGLYNLIWFTNTGQLDTTKTHRTGNGVIYDFEPQADGKFLCSGTGTVYDGQPVRTIFRVHPDGALDTTFDSQMTWGDADAFLPLPDGRAYMVGICRREGFPNDTIRVARFMPDGSLDPTFNSNINFGLGELQNSLGLGAVLTNVQPWGTDGILLTGRFQYVNGQVRRGLCVLDTNGLLRPEFDGAGVGTFVYQNTVTGATTGTFLTSDNMLYVYGGYHGYTDGITNDPDQRFITRLYGPDLSTSVAEERTPTAALMVVPNPTSGSFELRWPAAPGAAWLRLLDASGREVHSASLVSGPTQHHLSVRVDPGAYVVEVVGADGRMWHARVVVE